MSLFTVKVQLPLWRPAMILVNWLSSTTPQGMATVGIILFCDYSKIHRLWVGLPQLYWRKTIVIFWESTRNTLIAFFAMWRPILYVYRSTARMFWCWNEWPNNVGSIQPSSTVIDKPFDGPEIILFYSLLNRYTVMSGTPSKMLEHLLETRLGAQMVVSGIDPFLDDFLLTHIVFMPVVQLVDELAN